jgi:outer membrane lipoprotein-sorting protein
MKSLFILTTCLACAAIGAAQEEDATKRKAPPPVFKTVPEGFQREKAETPETVDALLDRMESARKKLKTLRADVIMTRNVELLDLKETFHGTLYFKMPRLVRLQLRNRETNEETISIAGKTYGWIYRVHRQQAERGKLADLDAKSRPVNPFEYGLARDIHTVREGYNLKLHPPEKIADRQVVRLELAPKGGTDYAAGKLILWIDCRAFLPVQVREFKSNGEIVETHTFRQMEVNVPISDDRFEFEPPEGVDVILHEAE